MTDKLFEWEQDQGVELTIPSVGGVSLDMPDDDARERQLRLARAENLAKDAKAGIALLREIATGMALHTETDPPQSYSTEGLDEASRTLLSEVLGRGEVYGQLGGNAPLAVQESIFPGLWRVKDATRTDAPECLVVADVPVQFRHAASHAIDPAMTIPDESRTGADVMNALPVLAELRDRARAYIPGIAENHVVNFTLLPMSEGDMALLRKTLGAGHVELTSKGYGACRVCSTKWANVWSVQFFNAMDTIILDSLEVGDVPVSVRAAGMDFADSAERIQDVIEAYL